MTVTKIFSLPERDVEHERLISIVFNVPPQQAGLISLLAKGGIASTHQIRQYLDSKTHPKIIVTHVRSKLRENGMDIKSRPNVGYWMDENTRKQIDHLTSQFVREM